MAKKGILWITKDVPRYIKESTSESDANMAPPG